MTSPQVGTGFIEFKSAAAGIGLYYTGEWDDRLEHLAQVWADGCEFRHGKPQGMSYPGAYGQNLYIGGDPTGYLSMWMWYEEYVHYDLRKDYCKPGEQCGHYIQLAWAPSKRLGCGITKCGIKYLIVCHYYPAALRKVQMYEVAKPCSLCPDEDKALCLNNLCISQEQCERNSEHCAKATCNMECLNCGKLNKTACDCLCADGWDAPDCSRVCEDEHKRCGVSPGFPNKASCSLNKHAVGNKYCRKMCGSCNPYNEEEMINHSCCGGKSCESGYVLDERKCKCTLLCPGLLCDTLEAKGSVFENYFVNVILQVMIVYLITKQFLN
ncbi:hypothetical protein TNCV_4657281 [Trichonephila clavipes]|nr:hypothetical protein TNCV_4657281 [Trichonephila clavipes]